MMFKKEPKEHKVVVLPEKIRKCYSFNYRLSYDEAYEAFYLISDKWSLKAKRISIALLSLAALIMLIMQFKEPGAFHYTFLAIVAIVLLFLIIYRPTMKARSGAKKVAKALGDYRFKISKEGEIIFEDGRNIYLDGDSESRAFETDDIFAFRPDGVNTFCIPKRELTVKEIGEIREIFIAYMNYNHI